MQQSNEHSPMRKSFPITSLPFLKFNFLCLCSSSQSSVFVRKGVIWILKRVFTLPCLTLSDLNAAWSGCNICKIHLPSCLASEVWERRSLARSLSDFGFFSFWLLSHLQSSVTLIWMLVHFCTDDHVKFQWKLWCMSAYRLRSATVHYCFKILSE